MAITYEWSFPQFEVSPQVGELTDVVVTIHWELVGTDEDDVSTRIYGTVTLGPPSIDDFTGFESITKEQTISWVSSVLDVNSMKANIAASIDMMKNPPSIAMAPPFN